MQYNGTGDVTSRSWSRRSSCLWLVFSRLSLLLLGLMALALLAMILHPDRYTLTNLAPSFVQQTKRADPVLETSNSTTNNSSSSVKKTSSSSNSSFVQQTKRADPVLETSNSTTNNSSSSVKKTSSSSNSSQPPIQNTSNEQSFTVVTGLFDIGRGAWNSPYARTYAKYLEYTAQLMSLKVNIVAFVDSQAAEAIRRMRRNFENQTKIVEMALEDLPYYRHRKRILEIMQSDEYRRDSSQVRSKTPEAITPEYDIITLSKPYFVDRATHMNPFNSSYFIWLDGGYGHGNKIYPKDGVWKLHNLLEYSDKVTMIEREAGIEAFRKDIYRLHKIGIAVINGGFIAGGIKPLQRLHELEQQVVAEWLKRGVIDDDQSSMMMVYFKEPSLFRFIHGDWYDVFKFFNKPG